MWLRGDLVGEHRGGASYQSGQWFTESRKPMRKAEREALDVLRGLACLCITVLLCPGHQFLFQSVAGATLFMATESPCVPRQDALPPVRAGWAQTVWWTAAYLLCVDQAVSQRIAKDFRDKFKGPSSGSYSAQGKMDPLKMEIRYVQKLTFIDLCRSCLPALGSEALKECGELESNTTSNLTSVTFIYKWNKESNDPRKVVWVQKKKWLEKCINKHQ